MVALDVERWRSLFPLAEERIYLNHASEGPLPATAVRAMARACRRNAAPHTMTLDHYFGLPRRCREKMAALVGADPTEIALASSTSYGLNVAANALAGGMREGDEVLVWRGEFPANVYPWLNLRRAGIDVRLAGGPLLFPSVDAVRDALGERTRVLALSWVSFATGYRADLEAVGRLCRDRGVRFVVDGVQGVGALAVDLPRLPVDVLACAGHKWLLGPVGTGFLYVRRDLMEALPPPFAGWVSRLEKERFAGLTDYDRPLSPDATRYEVGSPPDILLETLEASLDLLLDTSVEAIEERLRRLNARFVGALPDGWEIVSPWGPENPRASGILSLRREGTDPAAAARALYKAGAFAVAREGLLRISPHVYIREEEMERAAAALAGV